MGVTDLEPSPCPWCEYDRPSIVETSIVRTVMHQVLCANCGARGPQKRLKPDAVKDWNRVTRQ